MGEPYDHVIAVTGCLGSGKSTVSRLLADAGATLVSADALAREAVQPGARVLEQIAGEFGADVLTSAGELDRRRLGAKVFQDAGARKRLEELLHPIIGALAKDRFSRAIAEGQTFIVYDCPLYFEANLNRLGFLDEIFVDAPEDACVARVMSRDGLTKAEAESRIRAQLPPEQKRKRARTVIRNAGTIEALKTEVDAYLLRRLPRS